MISLLHQWKGPKATKDSIDEENAAVGGGGGEHYMVITNKSSRGCLLIHGNIKFKFRISNKFSLSTFAFAMQVIQIGHCSNITTSSLDISTADVKVVVIF